MFDISPTRPKPSSEANPLPQHPASSSHIHFPGSSSPDKTSYQASPGLSSVAPKPRKLSIIPFLGRSRRKSQSGTQHGSPVIEQTNSDWIASAQVPFAHHHDQVLDPRNSISSDLSAVSFSSKISARFSRRRADTARLKPSRLGPGVSMESLTLPSPSPRASSFDSFSSAQSRSATPKPLQPTITVSKPPNGSPSSSDEYFSDLFVTLPNAASSSQDLKNIGGMRDEDTNSVASTSSIVAKSSPPTSPRVREANRTDISLPAIKPAKRHNSVRVEKKRERAEDLGRSNVLDAISRPSLKLRSDATAIQIPQLPPKISLPRKTPTKRSSQPPRIPLPATPPSPTGVHNSTASSQGVRPRAQTFTSSRSRHISSPPLTPTQATLKKNEIPVPALPPMLNSPRSLDQLLKTSERMDETRLQSATPEQLRQTIQTQVTRFDELAAYLLTMADMHAAEKSILEKRIDVLEKEAKKKEKEIKGLRWLVTKDGSSISDSTPRPTPSRHNSLSPHSATRSRKSSQEEAPSFDSGSDSLSATNVPVYTRKRRSTVASNPASHSMSQNLPPLPPIAKRSSMVSLASSAGSSTHSLLIPTSPSLSAIPEMPLLTRSSYEFTSPASSDLESEKRSEGEDQFPKRTDHRLSTSSASSSASVSYINTLNKDRASSIAQVLERSSDLGKAPKTR